MKTNLKIETVNSTEFKKQYKGFLKKNLQPQILLISQSSDFTSQTKVLQIIDELKQDILIITSRNKVIGYAIKELDVLKHEQGKQLFTFTDGALNFVSEINSKNVATTFKTLPNRSVNAETFEAWQQVEMVLKIKKETEKQVNEHVENILGSKLTKDNINKAKEIFNSNTELVELIKLKESNYRKAFEGFIKQYGFNCFDYQLRLES